MEVQTIQRLLTLRPISTLATFSALAGILWGIPLSSYAMDEKLPSIEIHLEQLELLKKPVALPEKKLQALAASPTVTPAQKPHTTAAPMVKKAAKPSKKTAKTKTKAKTSAVTTTTAKTKAKPHTAKEKKKIAEAKAPASGISKYIPLLPPAKEQAEPEAVAALTPEKQLNKPVEAKEEQQPLFPGGLPEWLPFIGHNSSAQEKALILPPVSKDSAKKDSVNEAKTDIPPAKHAEAIAKKKATDKTEHYSAPKDTHPKKTVDAKPKPATIKKIASHNTGAIPNPTHKASTTPVKTPQAAIVAVDKAAPVTAVTVSDAPTLPLPPLPSIPTPLVAPIVTTPQDTATTGNEAPSLPPLPPLPALTPPQASALLPDLPTLPPETTASTTSNQDEPPLPTLPSPQALAAMIPAPTLAVPIPPPPAPGEAVKPEGKLLLRLTYKPEAIDMPPQEKTRLSTIAKQLLADKKGHIAIVSYATSQENQAGSDRRISLQRAVALRNELMQEGLDSQGINVKAMGNNAPDGAKDHVDIFMME